MAIICPKCQRHVEPIKVFDRSPKTGKPWLITRCSYDRCGWNFDIEEYHELIPKPDKKRFVGDDWKFGL